MAPKLTTVAALSLFAVAAPVSAAGQDSDRTSGAPAASADARYCMRVEAMTGSRIETIECWTRTEWAENGVDVDEDWATEGVAVIAGQGSAKS
jgi:hypothetical protein